MDCLVLTWRAQSILYGVLLDFLKNRWLLALDVVVHRALWVVTNVDILLTFYSQKASNLGQKQHLL